MRECVFIASSFARNIHSHYSTNLFPFDIHGYPFLLVQFANLPSTPLPPKVTQSPIDSSDMIRNSRFFHTRVSLTSRVPIPMSPPSFHSTSIDRSFFSDATESSVLVCLGYQASIGASPDSASNVSTILLHFSLASLKRV